MSTKNNMTVRFHHQRLTSRSQQPSVGLFTGIEVEYIVPHIYEISETANLELPFYKI